LINIVKKLENIDEELIEIIDEYQTMQKKIMQKKHPPTEVFVAFKRFEVGIEKILRERIIAVVDLINENGFSGIRELLEPGVFDSLYIPQKKQNQSQLSNVDIFCNSDELGDIKNSVWMMPHIFYSDSFFSKPAITNIDEITEGSPYLIEICEIPNILFLTVAELKAIKNQLKDSFSNFHSEVANWADACYNSSESASYFKENVFPLLPTLKAEIENNQLLKHTYNSIQKSIQLNKERQVCHVYLGEVGVENLMELYKDGNMFSDEDVSSITAHYNNHPNATFPVMLFSISRKLTYLDAAYRNELDNKNKEEIEKEIEPEIVVPKKNFSID